MRIRAIDASRGLAASGVLVSAAVHLNLWDVERFRLIPTIGPLFLLNAIGGFVLGVVIVAWRHWLPALAAAGYGAVTVLFFWISVIHGLFGFKEVASGSAQILAEVAEYVAVIFGLVAAAALWTGLPGRPSPRRVPADGPGMNGWPGARVPASTAPTKTTQ
jgi:uncharacterized membrane protein YtjA (UPF0391 family)